MTSLATTPAAARAPATPAAPLPREALSPPPPARRERRLQVALVLTLLVTYAYVLPHWADWNQNSRLDLTLAVLRESRLPIDTFHQNTGDKAQFPPNRGHYYSEKTIGTSLLALGPVFLADRLTAWPPLAHRLERVAASPAFAGTLNKEGAGTGIERVRIFVALLFATFFVVSLPSALLGGLLFSVLRRWLISPGARVLLVLGYGLGTPALAYAGAFYGHQAAAVFLFTAFALLLRERPSRGRVMLAGLALGTALLLEYSSILAVPLLALYAWHQTERGRRGAAALPLLAFLVPFSLQFAYNAAVFGSPFATGYRYTEFAKVAPAGFQIPTLASIYGVSFSPFRGIFFRSPVLLLAFPGFVFWWRNAKLRAEWWFCLALILLFLLYNVSYQVWSGGFSVGPRHFVSVLPFFLPPLAVFWQQGVARRARGQAAPFSPFLLASLLLLAGIVLCAGEAWARQGYPTDTPGMTWAKHALPAWQSGNIARNVGMLLGLHGVFSLAPLALLIASIWGVALARVQRASSSNRPLSAASRAPEGA